MSKAAPEIERSRRVKTSRKLDEPKMAKPLDATLVVFPRLDFPVTRLSVGELVPLAQDAPP